MNVVSSDTVRIAPKFDCGLQWAAADFENGGKKIAVRWERQGEEIVLTVENNGFAVVLDVGEIMSKKIQNNKTVYHIKA